MPSCSRPSRVHAVADAGRIQQIDGDLLQHAGADAGRDIVAVAPLEHDAVDAGHVQQLAEQQAGGTRRR